MTENLVKNAEKTLKNNANPCGTGVIRFFMGEIVFKTTKPLTVSEIVEKLNERYPGVQHKLVRRILEEIKVTGLFGLPLQSVIRRSKYTKCQAYYIQEPKTKKYVQQSIWR